MNKVVAIVLIVMVLLLTIIVGVGGYFLYQKQNVNEQNTNKIEQVEEKKESSIMFKTDIESIVLNVLNSKGVNKMMKLSFSIKYSDQLYTPKIEEYKTEINDLVITLISSKSSEELMTQNGKNLLKEDLLKELNKLFEKEKIEIKQDLFREFVIK